MRDKASIDWQVVHRLVPSVRISRMNRTRQHTLESRGQPQRLEGKQHTPFSGLSRSLYRYLFKRKQKNLTPNDLCQQSGTRNLRLQASLLSWWLQAARSLNTSCPRQAAQM